MVLFVILLTIFLDPAPAFCEVSIAKANKIDIWYETFGEKKNPPLLLIMGALAQGILWPTEFCEQLAGEGFYVIRYDHRDSGYSSCFDFEQDPYDLLEMAKDGVGLLDYLEIDKAQLCGLSTGGSIAELIAVHFPDRVSAMTLIAASPDQRPSTLAFEGRESPESPFSRPKKVYLDWMQNFLQNPPLTMEDNLRGRVVAWEILNGPVVPFETERYYEIHREFLSRLKHPESLTNHLKATNLSFEMILAAPYQVKVPTLIIQGTEDPIFPPDHGAALAQAITGSRYMLVEGFGHVLNRSFYDLFIQSMKEMTKKTIPLDLIE